MVAYFRQALGSVTPVLYAALGACFGFYFLGSFISVAIIFIFVTLAFLCFFRVIASINSEARNIKQMEILCTAFTVGLCIGVCAQFASRNDVKLGIPESNVIALNGVLLEDPRLISGNRAMARMSLRETAGTGGLRVSASGEVTVFFPEDNALKAREFGRRTTIFVEGRLRSEQRRSEQRNSAGTVWTFSAQSMHVVKKASPLEQMRTNIRLTLIQKFEGKNWGGLALAMLIGIRDNLDTNLTSLYRSAGLSYILALSGMHLAVLAAIIAFLLKKPLGLKPAAIAGGVIVILYCFIVGPLPSLNRAALMYLLGVLAILGALPKNTLSVLALSFLIQIIITPAAGNTISFILSYLAMLGILIIAKALVSLLTGKVPDFLLQPLAISCGAFLATAGISSYTFGTIAPAGIIAALVIVPATTIFMTGSIIYLVLDIISLAWILDLPLSLLYTLVEKTASFAGVVPGITSSKPFMILFISLILSLMIVVFEYKSRSARLKLKSFL